RETSDSTERYSSTVKKPRPMPLWFVIMMSLNPFDFRRRNAWGTPGKTSTCLRWKQKSASSMIVPSPSIKTAADNSLPTFGILSKTGHQFISRHGRCSKLAYDHCARVVGDFRRFGRSRSAGEAEGKKSDGRITCSRYIENLSCFGGDVMGRFFFLEKHHAVFAQGDEDIFCFPFF